ncbi:hypothetical protein ABZ615_25665 [Streptomyces sp. NPDC007325]|uniref:hypothetical protein n=1 Tax=Streptomyces sp. NPDC007325 TaxID=3154588 RepID=UPI0033D7E273
MMKHTKGWATACVVAGLLATTAACSSDDQARPDPTATPTAKCATGTYAWSDVVRRDVLTGVAEKQTFGKNGGMLTQPLRRLHTPRTEATTETGPKVEPVAALRSLGAHIGGAGKDSAFSEAGRPAPDVDGNTTDTSGPGTLVTYAYVEEVTAAFRRTCAGGEPSTGRATSWTVEGSGVLDCGQPQTAFDDSEPAREAALLSCAPGAPATKD